MIYHPMLFFWKYSNNIITITILGMSHPQYPVVEPNPGNGKKNKHVSSAERNIISIDIGVFSS